MSEESKRPRYFVSAKRAGEGNDEDQWFDVAAIFLSRNGYGYDVLVKENLADILANDRLFIRPPKPKKKADESAKRTE